MAKFADLKNAKIFFFNLCLDVLSQQKIPTVIQQILKRPPSFGEKRRFQVISSTNILPTVTWPTPAVDDQCR